MSAPPTLRWEDGRLVLLDQTRLPHHVDEVVQVDAAQVRDSIARLVVRGAPAIGVAAAYGMVVALQPHVGSDREGFLARAEEEATLLVATRPTAVNLRWAVERVVEALRASSAGDGVALLAVTEAEARAIHEEDRAQCAAIGRHGAPLVPAGSSVLTHCNAGALATTGIGTALAPLYVAHEAGVPFSVVADETRPLLQGARLTAFELQQAGIDVAVSADGAAAQLMAEGGIDLVIVGADRVAANGDVANKVGTLGVALAAQRFGVPFYVACPWSTIDLDTPGGAHIEIEERPDEEVTRLAGVAVAAPGVPARNPAFDVTPHDLVAGLITDRGVLRPPYLQALAAQGAHEAPT